MRRWMKRLPACVPSPAAEGLQAGSSLASLEFVELSTPLQQLQVLGVGIIAITDCSFSPVHLLLPLILLFVFPLFSLFLPFILV